MKLVRWFWRITYIFRNIGNVCIFAFLLNINPPPPLEKSVALVFLLIKDVGWNWFHGSEEEDFEMSSMYFSLLVPIWSEHGTSFEQPRNLFTQGSFESKKGTINTTPPKFRRDGNGGGYSYMFRYDNYRYASTCIYMHTIYCDIKRKLTNMQSIQAN